MLIVAPSGSTEAADLVVHARPRFSSRCIVSGSVPLLLAVLNAVSSAGDSGPSSR